MKNQNALHESTLGVTSTKQWMSTNKKTLALTRSNIYVIDARCASNSAPQRRAQTYAPPQPPFTVLVDFTPKLVVRSETNIILS